MKNVVGWIRQVGQDYPTPGFSPRDLLDFPVNSGFTFRLSPYNPGKFLPKLQ